MELTEIRQLLDLDTEEAREDLWSRFQLTPAEAQQMVFQSSTNRESSVHSGGSPSSRRRARMKPTQRP
jgi:hypothetical protein